MFKKYGKESPSTIDLGIQPKPKLLITDPKFGQRRVAEILLRPDISKQEKDLLEKLRFKYDRGEIMLDDAVIPILEKYAPGEFISQENTQRVPDNVEPASGDLLGRLRGIPEDQIASWWAEMGQEKRDTLIDNYYESKKSNLSKVPFVPITDKTPASYPQYAVQPNQVNMPGWTVSQPTSMDKFLRVFTDRFVDLKKVVKAIEGTRGQLADALDPSLQQTLYSAKVKNDIDVFMRDELNPLLRDAVKKGATLEGLHEYIHNRHAPEANAYIATLINPKTGLPRMLDEGSGIKTADAIAYMNNLTPQQKAMYEPLALKYDAIAKKNVQILVDNGLESQKTVDAWTKSYQYYAPLYRTGMEEHGGLGTGRGFSVVGPSNKMRKGSVREVENVIASIAEQRERYVTRVHKNEIDRALVGLMKAYPDPNFWVAAKPDITTRVSAEPKVIGSPLVKIVDQSYKFQDNVIMSRSINPKTGNIVQQGVEFRLDNDRAKETVKALKNLDLDRLGMFLNTSAKITRFTASMNTQYNLVFGVVNFARDYQAAMFNLSTTEIKGKQREVSMLVLPALKTVYKSLRAETKGKGLVGTTPLDAAWADFKAHGGLVGYRNLFDTRESRTKVLENEMKRLSGSAPRQTWHVVKSWLSDYNTSIESAVRLAAYQVGVQNGMTKDRAAAMAKNLTVDFNKKGQIATQAGTLYAFFNASMQGTMRTLDTLTGPVGRKIIAGGILLGVIQQMVLLAFGFKEDQPPEFIRERSLIIPTGGTNYITIPMSLGFHVLPNIGRIVSAWVVGDFKHPLKRATDLIGVMLESSNPIGSSGLSLQTIAPTPVDPLVALAENKDWTGKRIYREDFSALNPTPGYTRTKDSATQFSRVFSQVLNSMSGGTKYQPGLFSPTPDQIDFLIGQAGGGIAREVVKTGKVVTNLMANEKTLPYQMPLISRFYGSIKAQTSEISTFYRNLKAINSHELEIRGRMKNHEPITEYLRENPEARYFKIANKIERQISRLKTKRDQFVERRINKSVIERIDVLILLRMKQLNDMVRKTEGVSK